MLCTTLQNCPDVRVFYFIIAEAQEQEVMEHEILNAIEKILAKEHHG